MNKILEILNKALGFIKKFYKDNTEIIIPTLVMVSISVVVTLALSSTNMLTEGKIAQITKQNTDKAMAKVIDAEAYEELTAQVDGEQISYYKATNGEETAGYIFIVAAKGYGGDVSVMTAVNGDLTVKAVEILDAPDETPGLGQNITKESFYNQYEGLKKDVTVVKNGADSEANEINAVTGATISSKAVTGAVNKSLQAAEAVINLEGGNS